MRDWWLRTLLVLQSPRSVFAALRDDSREAAGARQEPIIAIAKKAQSEDPAARYQDVRSLAADINRFLEGRAVGAHREHFIDRAARVMRRYRLPIAMVLTYLVIRLLLLWIVKI